MNFSVKKATKNLFLIMSVLFEFNSQAQENKSIVEISHAAAVKLDLNQKLSDVDKTGNVSVRVAELGIGFEAPEQNIAGLFLFLAEHDMSEIKFDEVSLAFEPMKMFGVKAGHFCMPFGELATELLSDPLILDEVETKAAGGRARAEARGVSMEIAAYNSLLSRRIEAGTAKAGYSFKESANINVSLRSEPGPHLDLDIAFSLKPIAKMKILGEAFKGLIRPENESMPMGFYAEADVTIIEPLLAGIRYERMTDGRQHPNGLARISAGTIFSIIDNISVGGELGMETFIDSGNHGQWEKSILLRFSLELE